MCQSCQELHGTLTFIIKSSFFHTCQESILMNVQVYMSIKSVMPFSMWYSFAAHNRVYMTAQYFDDDDNCDDGRNFFLFLL
jgi:hypothetical protein